MQRVKMKERFVKHVPEDDGSVGSIKNDAEA